MDVLLLQPDFDSKNGPLAFEPPPLALIELSSYLSKMNIDNKIIDGSFLNVRKFEKYLNSVHPKVLGIILKADASSEILKFLGDNSGKHDFSFVAFGPYCKGREEALLKLGFDFVIPGEVEDTFLELYSTLCVPMNPFFDHIEGISYLNAQGEVTMTPERHIMKCADDYPWNNLGAIDLSQYDTNFFPYSTNHINYALVSEDCQKSPLEVAQELEYLKQTIKGVYLYDAELCSIFTSELLKAFDRLDINLPVMFYVDSEEDINFMMDHQMKHACVNSRLLKKMHVPFFESLENMYLHVDDDHQDMTALRYYTEKYHVGRIYTYDINYSMQVRAAKFLKRVKKENSLLDNILEFLGI